MEEWYYKEFSTSGKMAFNLAHLAVWFIVLQAAVAIMAKCHMSAEARDEIINDLQSMKKVELNMKSWALLLAHITGQAVQYVFGCGSTRSQHYVQIVS